MEGNYIIIDYRAWFGISVLLLLSFLTANPAVTFFAILFIPIAALLLFRRNEPPFLFIAILFQWLQVTIKVFYADYFNLSFDSVFAFSKHIYEAYYYSLFGLISIAFGIWLVLRNVPVAERSTYLNEVLGFNGRKLMNAYLIAIVLAPLLMKYSFVAGGLQQFMIKLADLKWALFFLLFQVTFLTGNYKKAFYLIVTVEVILSFTGFFSSFKDYFLVLGIGYVMIYPRMKAKNMVWMGIAAAILFNLFVVWTYVKVEYRRFLTGGEKSQAIAVGKEDALKELVQLTNKMDTAKYHEGFTRLVERTSYIDFFSASIGYVPKFRPHENGALWLGALTHTFTPRILFPNKAPIDDSKVAMKYTGLKFADASEGVSITLGYMGETYVDFGFDFLWLPLILFGVMIGYIYRYLLKSSVNYIWGYALSLPLFFQLNVFEQSLIKTVAGTIAYILVIKILQKGGFINYINRKIMTA